MTETTAYATVAQELREAIKRGDFANGRQLPTEFELCRRYSLSRQTVRRALQELVVEGLVFRIRGRGTFATALSAGAPYMHSLRSIDDLMSLSEDTDRKVLRPLEEKAEIEAASRLQLDTDQVMTALFVRRHGDVPFCVVEVFAPPGIGRELAARSVLAAAGEQSSHTVLTTLDEIVRDGIAGANQSVTAVVVPDAFAPLLDLPLGAPVLRLDRLYFDVRGQPIYLAINHFNPQRYSYRVQLRRNRSGGVTAKRRSIDASS
jgi:DNA-binding GntR family transcriptional regulator